MIVPNVARLEVIACLLRHFSSIEAYSDIIFELDLIADLDAETPQGNYYDLEALFYPINHKSQLPEQKKRLLDARLCKEIPWE